MAGGRHHHPYCGKNTCMPCYRHHQAFWSKTFAIRHPEEKPSHVKYRKAKALRERRCQICNRKRKKRLWYCDRCREEMLRGRLMTKWRRQNNHRRMRNLARGKARPDRWRIAA